MDVATPAVEARLAAYYARYYRDVLGLPGWPRHVAVRMADEPNEARRLRRMEEAIGRPVRGCRLLNVGCGTGGFNRVAQRAGARVWGLDADGEAVAIAALRGGGPAVRGLAESLPFAAGAFDLVYCYSTLEHVQEPRRALAEMVRVLADDGAIYLHAPHRWSWLEGHYKVFWVPGMPAWATRAYLAGRRRPTAFLATIHPLTLAECRQYLEDAGARIARILDGGGLRPVGGPLWPLVRLYYRLSGVRQNIELVAVRNRR
jgi:SAM-dependent methyltransferase